MKIVHRLLWLAFVFSQVNSLSAQSTDLVIEFEQSQDLDSWVQFANGSDDPGYLFMDDNPNIWGINRTQKCGRLIIQNDAQPWAGIYTDAHGPIEITPLMHTVEIMIYKTTFSEILFKLEDPSIDPIEVSVQNSKINEWELLTFDLSGAIGKTFSRITLFPDYQSPRTSGSDCRIDNIRFITYPVTVSSENLIAFYPFNGNALDVSGNENHGEVVGARLTRDRFGVENSAYYFDGMDDYIDMGRDHSINPGQSFSISCFIKPEPNGSNGVIFRNRYYGFALMANPLGGVQLDVYVYNNGGEATRTAYASYEIMDHQWHHVAATWDSYTSKIYVDGELIIEESAIGEEIIYSGNAAAMGRDGDGDVFFYKGAIDNFRIYENVLDPYEVWSLSQTDAYQMVYDTVYDQSRLFEYPVYREGPVKYLLFESYYSEDSDQVNVYELQAYANGVNLALNGHGYISSSVESGGYAVDGNHSTRWSSDRSRPGPDMEDPHILLIVLDEPILLDSILLDIQGFDAWNQTFSMIVSRDSVNWKLLDRREDTTGIFTYPIFNRKAVSLPDTVYTTQYDTVFITDPGGVSVTDTLIIDVTLTGVDPPGIINSLRIYPNPARDYVFIETGNYMEMNGYLLRIVNQLGSIVFETSVEIPLYAVDLSSWTGTGTYYFQVIDPSGEKIETRMIILE